MFYLLASLLFLGRLHALLGGNLTNPPLPTQRKHLPISPCIGHISLHHFWDKRLASWYVDLRRKNQWSNLLTLPSLCLSSARLILPPVLAQELLIFTSQVPERQNWGRLAASPSLPYFHSLNAMQANFHTFLGEKLFVHLFVCPVFLWGSLILHTCQLLLSQIPTDKTLTICTQPMPTLLTVLTSRLLLRYWPFFPCRVSWRLLSQSHSQPDQPSLISSSLHFYICNCLSSLEIVGGDCITFSSQIPFAPGGGRSALPPVSLCMHKMETIITATYQYWFL